MRLSQFKLSTLIVFGATALTTGFVALGSTAFAQTDNRSFHQIVDQLARAVVLLSGDYRMTHEPKVDTLRNQNKEWITLNLRTGINYGVIGVCDGYCTDVDLRLYDENYNLLDQDASYNDTPVVTVTPRRTGSFYVEVDMEDCQANYCYYGVGVFGK